MKTLKKINKTVLSLVALLLLSACTGINENEMNADNNVEKEMPTEAEDAEEIASTQGIETLEPVLTFDDALALFYSTFEKENINFEVIQFEKDDSGNYHYVIQGWDDKYTYRLAVDVGTAEIIEQEMKVPVQVDNILDLEAAITPKEAMEAALEDLEDEAVEEWRLKVDSTNRMIYEIEFLSGNSQKVDALTGKVL